jgi:hypothetical protein
LRIDGDFVRGLADQSRIGGDEAGRNGGLGLGAAREQAALDEQAIGAEADFHAAQVTTRHAGGQRIGTVPGRVPARAACSVSLGARLRQRQPKNAV